MSIKIMSWVLDNSPYDGKSRLVHLVLADHANDAGICWPSQATIAKRAGCSVEHVRMTVKQMQADGLIEIVSHATREGQTNQYRLLSPSGLGTLPKSSRTPPQMDGPTSPNPSSKEPSGTIKENQAARCPGCQRRHDPREGCF